MNCMNVVYKMNNFQKKAIIAYRMRRVKENDWYEKYRKRTIERVRQEFSLMVKVPLDKLSINIEAIEYRGMNMTFEYNQMVFFATRVVSTDFPGDFVDIYFVRECSRCGIMINQPVHSLEQIGGVLMTPLSKEHTCLISVVVSRGLKSLFKKISGMERRCAGYLFKR